MPTYDPRSADPATVRQAYATASRLTNNRTVLLALFQAGLVESNFRNVNYGDRDSLGYLQQRPSQGWPNPRNIATATTSFVNKALAALRANPQLTAGQLAQRVQVSAFPDRYQQANAAATTLLNNAIRAGGGTPPSGAGTNTGGGSNTGNVVGALDAAITGAGAGATAVAANSTVGGLADDALGGIADAIKQAFEPLLALSGLSDQLMKFFLPTTLVRVVCGIAGAFFLIMGIALLAREVSRSDSNA